MRDVFVDGRQVVSDGKVAAFDLSDATARLEEAQRRAEECFTGLDFAGRHPRDVSPLTYSVAG